VRFDLVSATVNREMVKIRSLLVFSFISIVNVYLLSLFTNNLHAVFKYPMNEKLEMPTTMTEPLDASDQNAILKWSF
jgi:hypothetical protein